MAKVESFFTEMVAMGSIKKAILVMVESLGKSRGLRFPLPKGLSNSNPVARAHIKVQKATDKALQLTHVRSITQRATAPNI